MNIVRIFLSASIVLAAACTSAGDRINHYTPELRADEGPTLLRDINPDHVTDDLVPNSEVRFKNGLLCTVDSIHGPELRFIGPDAHTLLFRGNRIGRPLAVGNVAYFAADDGLLGNELWKTDGTPDGTVLVKDVDPGADHGHPSNLVIAGDVLYFTNQDMLWRSDGTAAGTVAVAPIDRKIATPLIALGDRILFSAYGAPHGTELWTSDGTAAGTEMVKDIYPGRTDSMITLRGRVWNGHLYFTAKDPAHGEELWKTDGTAAGTTLVKDFVSGDGGSRPAIAQVTAAGLIVQVSVPGEGYQLWRSDGTDAGTVVFASRALGQSGSAYQTIIVDDVLHFVPSFSFESKLWRSDGTPTGTVAVADLPRWVSVLGQVNGRIILRADDGATGQEPWVSGGTNATTHLLRDIVPGRVSSRAASGGTIVGGNLHFTARNDHGFTELWKTDGTVAGTVLVPLRPTTGSRPEQFTVAGDRIYFSATTSLGTELWSSDGTEAGTSLVYERRSGPSSSWPYGLSQAGGRLFFGYNAILYTTDGTATGTEAITRISDGWFQDRWAKPVALGDRLLFDFHGFNTDTGTELWSSDGTPQGTRLVRDIAPGSATSHPQDLTRVGATVFFTANAGSRGRELWRTRGTASTTVRVADIDPDTGVASYAELTAVGNRLFFAVDNGVHGSELWSVTETGAPQLVKDINEGPGSGSIAQVTAVGEVAFFLADDGIHGLELWRSDGTEAGTFLVKDIGSGHSAPSALAAAGEHLFFIADDGIHGRELWRSDGSDDGTVLVKDIHLSGDANVRALHAVGSRVVFSADDGIHGQELWQSDGTAAGTVLVEDLHPTGDSDPASITVFGHRVYYTALDPEIGYEPRSLCLCDDGVECTDDSCTVDGGCVFTPVVTCDSSTDDNYVQWADLVGVSTSPDGRTLAKTAVWGWNSGAVSAASFTGPGGVSIPATATDGNIMVGLSRRNDGVGYQTIDYAFYLVPGGRLFVFERGSYRRSATTVFQSGDVLTVRRIDADTIVYELNGLTIYTSEIKTSEPLLVDASLYSVGATIHDAIMH